MIDCFPCNKRFMSVRCNDKWKRETYLVRFLIVRVDEPLKPFVESVHP